MNKTLVNCSAPEMLAQLYKLADYFAKYWEILKIAEIRKRLPQYEEGATDEQKQEVRKEQMKANMLEMVKAMFVDHNTETVEFLGLLCFMGKEEAMKADGYDLLEVFLDCISDERVMRSFFRLVPMAQQITKML